MFRRVLVANRGEIALRVIRACHEMGIEAVAVYSTADADSLHVREADEAVCIGPPEPRSSYLQQSNLIAAALTRGCEAVHPGYGFLSENSDFARLCSDQELVFIGPSPESMERLGDKSLAKQLFAEAGLPTIPGSEGPLSGADEARAVAAEVGYPVLLKAAAGGGGRGMRQVDLPDELERNFAAASSEAQSAFGNGALYLEKVIVAPHHIEVQVLADGHGGVLTLGERDCSIQRRHQKLLEETPSPLLTAEIRHDLERRVSRAVGQIGYRSAGTLEFLADQGGHFYFMEMNTRVQVEHPVTEMVTGFDIIREQIALAAGRPLTQTGRMRTQGHAIEMRICSEDPAKDFRPQGGMVTALRLPGGPGIRVDTHIYPGYTIPTFYDSLIAKLIAWDVDRPAAISRALRALGELRVEGVPTTARALAEVLAHPDFQSGNFSTGFLDAHRSELPSLRVQEAG